MQTNNDTRFKNALQPRVFTRVAHHAAITYTDGAGHKGEAETRNIGWGGLGISLGRYLRPGTPISFRVHPRDTVLAGAIVWCRPGEDDGFIAGLRLALDDVERLDALSALLLHAILHPNAAQIRSGKDVEVSTVMKAGVEESSCLCCVA